MKMFLATRFELIDRSALGCLPFFFFFFLIFFFFLMFSESIDLSHKDNDLY